MELTTITQGAVDGVPRDIEHEALHVGGTGLSRAGSSAHRYDEPADSEGQQ